MAVRRSGAQWSLASAGFAGKNGMLLAVACPGPTSCFAVGSVYGKDGRSTASAFAAWNGTIWTLTTKSSPPEPTLFGVACSSSFSCFAVGGRQGQYPYRTLTERWNGSQWKTVASPSVAGAIASAFESVACPSATNCVAVGISSTASSSKRLAERWNGTRWSII
jgi:hypothetical protein